MWQSNLKERERGGEREGERKAGERERGREGGRAKRERGSGHHTQVISLQTSLPC